MSRLPLQIMWRSISAPKQFLLPLFVATIYFFSICATLSASVGSAGHQRGRAPRGWGRHGVIYVAVATPLTDIADEVVFGWSIFFETHLHKLRGVHQQSPEAPPEDVRRC